jgi:hypothetical protein
MQDSVSAGALPSQLNKALSFCPRNFSIEIASRGDLRGDFFRNGIHFIRIMQEREDSGIISFFR